MVRARSDFFLFLSSIEFLKNGHPWTVACRLNSPQGEGGAQEKNALRYALKVAA